MPENEEENSAYEKLYQKKLQALQAELKKKELLRAVLSPEAYERMANVKLSNPELYDKVVSSLAYVFQSGRKIGKLSDAQLYQLLSRLSEKKETKIEFRHK